MKKILALILALTLLLNLSSFTFADDSALETHKALVDLDGNVVSITNVIADGTCEIEGLWDTYKTYTAVAPAKVTFESDTGRQRIYYSENWKLNKDGTAAININDPSVEYVDFDYTQYKIFNEEGNLIVVDSIPDDYFDYNDEYQYVAGSYTSLDKPGVYVVFTSGLASAGSYCVINVVEGTASAAPTSSKVVVDGKDVSFQAYNINGNNYFKLRDLAMILNGTDKQFEVGWDGDTNAISLTTGIAYIPVGGELAVSENNVEKEAIPTTSKIFLNGEEVKLKAYNIGGNNYFKLRDVGKAINFSVAWDGDTNTVIIDTTDVYTE